MRSFFSTLLLLNWGLLLVLLTLALGVFYIYDLVVPAVRPLILFGFVLIAIFGTFYISTNIAMRITDPLATVEKNQRNQCR